MHAHLNVFTKSFQIGITRIIDSSSYANWLKGLKSNGLVITKTKKVNLQLIDSLLHKKPIINLGAFQIYKSYHYPHFVTLLSQENGVYWYSDTWDGKIKSIDGKGLLKAIRELQYHFVPQNQRDSR